LQPYTESHQYPHTNEAVKQLTAFFVTLTPGGCTRRLFGFGEATVSDHRAVLHTMDITRAAGRCLKYQDPQIVMKYNQFLANVIKHEQLIQKIFKRLNWTQFKKTRGIQMLA